MGCPLKLEIIKIEKPKDMTPEEFIKNPGTTWKITVVCIVLIIGILLGITVNYFPTQPTPPETKTLELANTQLRAQLTNYNNTFDQIQTRIQDVQVNYQTILEKKNKQIEKLLEASTNITPITVISNTPNIETEDKLRKSMAQVLELETTIEKYQEEIKDRDTFEGELVAKIRELMSQRDALVYELTNVSRLKSRIQKMEYEKWMATRKEWVRSMNRTPMKGAEIMSSGIISERTSPKKFEENPVIKELMENK